MDVANNEEAVYYMYFQYQVGETDKFVKTLISVISVTLRYV